MRVKSWNFTFSIFKLIYNPFPQKNGFETRFSQLNKSIMLFE